MIYIYIFPLWYQHIHWIIVLSFPHFVAGIPRGDELATQGVVWREILHVFMTVAEIFRRSFWAILRIEYEQVPPGTVCLKHGEWAEWDADVVSILFCFFLKNTIDV